MRNGGSFEVLVDRAEAQLRLLRERAANVVLPSESGSIVLDEVLADMSVTLDELVAEVSVTLEELGVADQELTDTATRLLEAQRRSQELFEHGPDAYLVTDLAGNISEANAEALRLLQISLVHLTRKPLVVFVVPADRDRYRDALRRLSDDAEQVHLELELQPRRGDMFHASVNARIDHRHPGTNSLRWTIRDETEKHALATRLAYDATHDGLTGARNRTDFVSTLQSALDDHPAGDGHLAVLFVDLDRFKGVNDRYGHGAGDALLGAVAGRLRGCCRSRDLVARLGGDEFAIACENVADSDEAIDLAERIRAALASPFVLPDATVHIGASIGVALADHGSTADDLLRDSDAAMYCAKAKGRDRLEVFTTRLRDQTRQRLGTEEGLRRAVDEGQLRVHYLPALDLRTGEIASIEALVRWEHPDRGLVPANDFLSVAEDSGLIVPIGAWVTREACRQAGIWRRAGLGPGLALSINMSPLELAQPGVLDLIADTLRESGLPASNLVIEITERVATDAGGFGAEWCSDLHGLGVRVAIADFGAGYSSLSSLCNLDIDIVKIDRSFVSRITSTPKDRQIVNAIVGIAGVLGLETIAEGVEDESQLLAVLSAGCFVLQGNFLSEPLEPARLAALLAEPSHQNPTLIPPIPAHLQLTGVGGHAPHSRGVRLRRPLDLPVSRPQAADQTRRGSSASEANQSSMTRRRPPVRTRSVT
ncbi:MAG: EAL domain-containing protein [Acidimicrobiales bacterium]